MYIPSDIFFYYFRRYAGNSHMRLSDRFCHERAYAYFNGKRFIYLLSKTVYFSRGTVGDCVIRDFGINQGICSDYGTITYLRTLDYHTLGAYPNIVAYNNSIFRHIIFLLSD